VSRNRAQLEADEKKEEMAQLVTLRASLRLMFYARFVTWFLCLEVRMDIVHDRVLQIATAEVAQPEDKADSHFGLLDA
jgi:hypothetical protein